jgi:hypothetical protein
MSTVCEYCNHEFSSKRNLNNHLEAQIKCYDKKFKCDMCDGIYTTNIILKNHQKKCILIQKKIQIKYKKEEKKQKEDLKIIQTINNKNLNDCIINNIGVQNNINVNLNINNLIILPFGQENISHIDENMFTNILKKLENSPSFFAKLLHCDKSKPENNNIKILNSNIFVYDDTKKFVVMNKEDFFDELSYVQSTHISRLSKKHNPPKKLTIKYNESISDIAITGKSMNKDQQNKIHNYINNFSHNIQRNMPKKKLTLLQKKLEKKYCKSDVLPITQLNSKKNKNNSKILNDAKSESEDAKLESKDEKSETEDEKSETEDEKSESEDEKSETENEKSESEDEKSETEDEKSESEDEKIKQNKKQKNKENIKKTQDSDTADNSDKVDSIGFGKYDSDDSDFAFYRKNKKKS